MQQALPQIMASLECMLQVLMGEQSSRMGDQRDTALLGSMDAPCCSIENAVQVLHKHHTDMSGLELTYLGLSKS